MPETYNFKFVKVKNINQNNMMYTIRYKLLGSDVCVCVYVSMYMYECM